MSVIEPVTFYFSAPYRYPTSPKSRRRVGESELSARELGHWCKDKESMTHIAPISGDATKCKLIKDEPE